MRRFAFTTLSALLFHFAQITFFAAVFVPAHAATPTDRGTGSPTIPGSTSDRYVSGKYDSTGRFIPPHYEPRAKPAFSAFNHRDPKKHGYFNTMSTNPPQ